MNGVLKKENNNFVFEITEPEYNRIYNSLHKRSYTFLKQITALVIIGGIVCSYLIIKYKKDQKVNNIK